MVSKTLRLTVVPAIVALGLLAGCGGDDEDTTTATTAAPATSAAAPATTEAPATTAAESTETMDMSTMEMSTESSTAAATTEETSADTATAAVDPSATPAAELRAGLTTLLTDHVYLAGIAIHYALVDGGDLTKPSTAAAVQALDDNSVALSKAIGGVYPEAEAPFLESWRQHIGFFVDYTLGKATKDQAKVDKAKTDLDGYRTAFGQLINSVVPELPADAVAEELTPHVETLLAAIDAEVAGSPDQFSLLATAAGHMPMTAATLATGIAANQGLEGDVASDASALRAGLTYLLDEHVWLAGIAIDATVGVKGDLEDPISKGAVAALDANSVALSKAVGSAYPDAEAPFLDSWRQHIGFFVDYTLGKATADDAKVEKAKTDLDGYRTAFGQLINSVVPGLPADAVAQELVPHVQTLLDAIDADVAGSPETFAKLAAAATHMPMTAAVLASAISADKGLS